MGENQLAIYEEVVRQMVERLDHVEVPEISFIQTSWNGENIQCCYLCGKHLLLMWNT